MWSRLFEKSEVKNAEVKLSRFEKCHQLAALSKDILKLQKQDAELALEAHKKGAGSIAFLKHTVTAELLGNINDVILHFNLTPAKDDVIEELEDALVLLDRISIFVGAVINNDEDSLNVHRQNRVGDVAGKAGAAVILTAATAGSFAVFFAGFAALTASMGAWKKYESSCRDTYTFKLIRDLDGRIAAIRENLTTYIDRSKIPADIKKSIDQRTWGAIALAANPDACRIPRDVQSLILRQIISSHEKPEQLELLNLHNARLFNAARNMVAGHRQANAQPDSDAPPACSAPQL